MGIFWAVVLLGILIFIHELGHFIFSKKLGVRVLKFSLGLGPKLVGKKIGDTEYLISAIPFGGYVKPLGEDIDEKIKDEDKPFAFNYQPVWKKALIVFAGPFFNLLLTYLIFVFVLSFGFSVPVPKIEAVSTEINKIVKESPAEKAGLKTGDKIIAIDGKDIYSWDEVIVNVMHSAGKELEIKVERGKEILNFKIVPESYKAQDKNGNEIIVGRIGIVKNKSVAELIESKSLLDAPVKGFEATYKSIYLIFDVIKGLFTGSVSLKTLGGPIMIADVSAKIAPLGFVPYIMLMAMLSVNLGVLNLLPIPVLDGGHLLFFSIEAVRRKPLSKKTIMNAQRAGLAALLTLTVFVLYNDTMKIIVPWLKEFFVK